MQKLDPRGCDRSFISWDTVRWRGVSLRDTKFHARLQTSFFSMGRWPLKIHHIDVIMTLFNSLLISWMKIHVGINIFSLWDVHNDDKTIFKTTVWLLLSAWWEGLKPTIVWNLMQEPHTPPVHGPQAAWNLEKFRPFSRCAVLGTRI